MTTPKGSFSKYHIFKTPEKKASDRNDSTGLPLSNFFDSDYRVTKLFFSISDVASQV